MTTYCQYVASHPEDTFNKTYHDTEYGFPITDDNLLFERLVLEINQTGLLKLKFIAERPPPSPVLTEVALMAAEESAGYFMDG